MRYIILDLEWDSAYSVKHKRFINQILQIGAVKLNESFDIIDTFEVTVKSAISKRVTGRFAELTGITTEKMLAGVPLDTAVDRFNEWTDENAVTMTWSDSDLYSIKENEEALLSGGRTFKIGKYLDLQKFIQGELRLNGYTDKNQISLAAAAEKLARDIGDSGESGNVSYYVSDDPGLFCSSASIFLGTDITGRVTRIDIEKV